jgi:hypothetical protein
MARYSTYSTMLQPQNLTIYHQNETSTVPHSISYCADILTCALDIVIGTWSGARTSLMSGRRHSYFSNRLVGSSLTF